jgi:hypothetical protein
MEHSHVFFRRGRGIRNALVGSMRVARKTGIAGASAQTTIRQATGASMVDAADGVTSYDSAELGRAAIQLRPASRPTTLQPHRLPNVA